MLTTNDLAAFGIPKSTARRLLARLHREGIATRVPSARRPTYAITREALAAYLGLDMLDATPSTD